MLISIGLLLLLSASAPLGVRLLRARFGYLAAFLSAALLVWYATKIPIIVDHVELFEQVPWIPSLGVSLALRLDGLSLLFALLITGIGSLVALYAVGYLEDRTPLSTFWTALILFEAAMLGVVLADDVLLLFVFWELTSVTSFFLIGLAHERATARVNAQQALLVTAAGGLALLIGLLLLSSEEGTFRLSVLLDSSSLDSLDPLTTLAIILLIVGAAAKSAQVPFHFWLPNAMEAPTPVSAYLHSATMVKAGVYLLARFSPSLSSHPLWEPLLLTLGGVTAVIGGILAVPQHDLKRLLAYSTVSALGLLVFLLGMGGGGKAFTLFLLAHALYKGGAFLLAGAIEHATHKRTLDAVGGLWRISPSLTVAAALVVAAAVGLPPTLGFVAKESFLEATLEHGFPPLVVVLITALIAQGAVAWLLLRPFIVRAPRPMHPHPPDWKLVLGPTILGTSTFAMGLTLSFLEPLVTTVLESMTGPVGQPIKLALWHGLTPALVLSSGILVAGLVLMAVWPYLHQFGTRLKITEPLGEHHTALTQWCPESWYHQSLRLLSAGATWQTKLLQNGYLRIYTSVIVGTALVLAALTILRRSPPWSALPLLATPIDVVDFVLSVILLISALMAVRASERLAAIAALGALGFSLALLYARYGAPDLAITQVLVDTLMVVLLVFAFYRLPRYARLSSSVARVRDALLAAAFGLLMASLTLLVHTVERTKPITAFFAEAAYLQAHGRNIVNVILVDFRALDTLGEITVLAIAAVGVLALLRSRRRETT